VPNPTTVTPNVMRMTPIIRLRVNFSLKNKRPAIKITIDNDRKQVIDESLLFIEQYQKLAQDPSPELIEKKSV